MEAQASRRSTPANTATAHTTTGNNCRPSAAGPHQGTL